MADKSPIAVVGMAGIFPGSNNLDEFWLNIVNKIGKSKEIPKDRWIAPKEFMYDPDPQPDKAYSKYACLINNFKFDPNNFNIDPELVNSLDPLYHIVLYCGKTAIENSNIS